MFRLCMGWKGRKHSNYCHWKVIRVCLLWSAKEVNGLRDKLNNGPCRGDVEAIQSRHLESMRREDEVKLREALRQNDKLKTELEAMIGGAMRSDIGLVSVSLSRNVWLLLSPVSDDIQVSVLKHISSVRLVIAVLCDLGF